MAIEETKSPVVCAYGGGVNSVALVLLMIERGEIPTAIVMSDPGHEWPETHEYREKIVNPYLARHGIDPIVVVSLATESVHRPRAKDTAYGSLRDECMRIKSLPSIAYGWKKCSQKFKARPAQWWIERQPWAKQAWDLGARITRCIGYDTDEMRRMKAAFMDPIEARRFVPAYPLIDAGMDRDACVAMIKRHGFEPPHKSACVFCHSNKMAEWSEYRKRLPEDFEITMEMSRQAEIESPDVVGLMRCNKPGKRQLHLHIWQDEDKSDAEGAEMPCDCAF